MRVSVPIAAVRMHIVMHCLQLVRVSTLQGVFMMEALWGRFCPAQQALRALIRCGAIGEPLQGDARCAFEADFVRSPGLCQPFDRSPGFRLSMSTALVSAFARYQNWLCSVARNAQPQQTSSQTLTGSAQRPEAACHPQHQRPLQPTLLDRYAYHDPSARPDVPSVARRLTDASSTLCLAAGPCWTSASTRSAC